MPQINSVVCRQACVACWSDVLVKNNKMSVYFVFEAILRCVSRPVRTNKHPGFFGQSDFIVIAIRAKRLQTETKTTHRQPMFTFGKCKEMSSGTLLFTTRKDAPD